MRGWGGFVLVTLTTFLPSVISSLLPKIRGMGRVPWGPSPQDPPLLMGELIWTFDRGFLKPGEPW